MQSKLVAVASIAASVGAMKLETNNLAQVSDTSKYTHSYYGDSEGACHFDPYGGFGYGYSSHQLSYHNPYECIQEKVERVLAVMTQEVADHKAECELRADDLRAEIVGGVQDLRLSIQNGLASARAHAEVRLSEKLAQSTAAINAAVAAASDALNAEQLASKVRVSEKREETEKAIKELVYQCNQGYGYCDQYTLKDQIQSLVDAFDQFIEDEATSWEAFASQQNTQVNAVVAYEISCLANDIVAELSAWNAQASQGIADLDAEIAAQIARMDQVIADKTVAVNAIIANLEENFLIVFWETLVEIQETVDYYERKPLVHKALYAKEDFLAAVSALRDLLLQNLASTRATLVGELAAERSGMVSWINNQRDGFVAATNQMRADLDLVAANAQATMNALISSLTEDLLAWFEQQQTLLEKFVYEVASQLYKPKVYVSQDKGDVSLVVATLENQIATYGDAIFAVHDATVRAALDSMQASKQEQIDELAGDNIVAQTALDNLTIALITRITDARIALEAELLITQDAQEATDEAARDIDQIALVTTKNELWKELSWLMRVLHGGHGYGHGQGALSSGYGFSRHTNRYAQKADDSHDVEDVYGYLGFGYGNDGKAQAKEIVDKMAAAQTETNQKNEDRINASRAALEATLNLAWEFYDQVLADKEAEFNAAVDAQNAAWAANVATRTGIVQEAHAQARASIEVARQVKEDALDKLEKEIRWAITSIHTHAHNKALADAMDAARAEADALWAAKKVAYDAEIEACEARWDAHVVSETASLDANTAEERQRCDDARAEQRALFEIYVDSAWVRFDLWAASEREAMAEFLADALDAWRWILKSYCLLKTDDDHDDDDQYGNSCRYNVDIGGYKKGIEIEVHDPLLSYGQPDGDDLDIKHIKDVARRIDYAVAFTMQGVAETAAAEAALVAAEQARIHAYVEVERQALELALTQRLNQSIATMDALVQELTDALRARQAAAEAAVDADREVMTQTIRDLREEILYIISDLVWELGYNKYDKDELPDIDFTFSFEEGVHHGTYEDPHRQSYAQLGSIVFGQGAHGESDYASQVTGYGYGGKRAQSSHQLNARDEEHDVEIRRLIVEQKDRFEAAVVDTIARMEARVAQEIADGDAAAEVAQQTFEDEAARLTAEMNQAIADAIASFEATLARAKAAIEAETDRAEAALEAFLQSRLAAWQEKYEWEKNRALWQKDSYYRYNLLRLLQAKDDAVNAAINQARADFAALMAAEEAESLAFRQEQRDNFYAFTAQTRVTLANAIAVDRQTLTDEIEERARTLAEFLAEQTQRLLDDMAECRENFRLALKAIYNNKDLTEVLILDKEPDDRQGDHSYTPYSEFQHKNFVYKFKQYLREQLAQLDAQLLAMQQSTDAQVLNISDEASLQALALEQENIDARVEKETALSALARQLLDAYQLTQDSELSILVDLRAAAEAAALSRAEELKKIIVYSAHVLKYATKQIIGPPNGLTGIDELDVRTYDNSDHYKFELAQLDKSGYSLLKDTHGDEHDQKLKEALEQAKQDFDDMVLACREDFQYAVDVDKEESNARKAQIDQDILDATGSSLAAQEDLAASSKAALAASNEARNANFLATTQATLDAFNAEVDALIEKIDGWFADRIEWVNKLYDDYLKDHLIADLEKKRDEAFAELEARKQQAQEIMDSMRQRLARLLADLEDLLWGSAQAQVESLAAFNINLRADTDAEGAAINASFAAAADLEATAKNASMDALEEKWAYWLRQVFNYQPYDQNTYNGFHDGLDYAAFPYADYNQGYKALNNQH